MFRIFVHTGTNLIVIVIREYTTYVKYIYLFYFLRSNARMIAIWCTLFSSLSFQMSYSDWPSDIFPGDFYKTYILGRPYQYHYAFLKNLNPQNASDVDLLLAERLVKKNFLSIDILTCLAMQELQVTEKTIFGFLCITARWGPEFMGWDNGCRCGRTCRTALLFPC